MAPMRRRALVLGGAAGLASLGLRTSAAQDSESGGFQHPEWFADTGWLKEQLGRDNLTVMALTPEPEFIAGHIPGAAKLEWPELEIVETSESSVETWIDSIEAILTDAGVERDDTVVVYDGGTFWASRLWWILHLLGHADVRILDGGLGAWIADGGALASGLPDVAAASESYQGVPDYSVIATIDQAVAALESGGATFVDARSSDEFAAGHIPGAVNIPYQQNAVAGPISYWKTPSDLHALYEDAGVLPGQRVIPYCSTGVRSAVTYFTLRQLGYEDVALFTGSFAEWSADPARPVEASS